ncbi:unnamed protein product [Chrysodeixis includens]|uniref:Uncharacterized protein n=1 Tax=Chrysodeixis includens TaxID=689277 RepID=A0A9P0BVC1_CHRIL|nr:unnamed protein product [Chrysodeixis includens]
MSDDEDCDDLPMIDVNSSVKDASSFEMPSADVVASQRAHELACEAELRDMRARAEHDERRLSVSRSPRARDRSSSGEDEAALAAAVRALDVLPRAAPPAPHTLCAALAPHLPSAAAPLAARLQSASQDTAAELLLRAVTSVIRTFRGEPGDWEDDDVLSTGAVLAAAVLGRVPRARRALHALLDDRATDAQLKKLCGLLAAAFPEARERMQLSDALRSGGGRGADRLAARLAAAALLQLLRPNTQDASEEVSVEQLADAAHSWAQLDEGSRYVCVQLAGRVLAAGAGDADPGQLAARRRLLAALVPPAAPSSRPDRLKVVVGVSKLKLLFQNSEN